MHINNDFQKNSNISNLLKLIWNKGEISQVDISRETGIYRSTISNIISSLLDKKIIVQGERGKSNEKGGRKPTFLSLNRKFGCIIGLEIQTDEYNLCVMSFSKEILYTETSKMPSQKQAEEHAAKMNGTITVSAGIKNSIKSTSGNSEQPVIFKPAEKIFIATIDIIIQSVLQTIKLNPTTSNIPVLGISIGMPGIVDSNNGIIIRSDPFKLMNFDCGKFLDKKYGIPFFIENDARCIAWLQLSKQMQGNQNENFLCVLARTYKDKTQGIGTGMSIAMNGHIISGSNHSAGEYISCSWDNDFLKQSGLSWEVINTISTRQDSYKAWLKDLFSTLTTIVPLLNPQYVFLHGQPGSYQELVTKTVQNEVPKFDSVCKHFGSKFVFVPADTYEIAQGAACLYIQKLFKITFKTDGIHSYLNWNYIFKLRDSLDSEKN